MTKYYWTIDSYGAGPIPEDAETVIAAANDMIDKYAANVGDDADDDIRDYSNALWEHYCRTGTVGPPEIYESEH